MTASSARYRIHAVSVVDCMFADKQWVMTCCSHVIQCSAESGQLADEVLWTARSGH